MPGRGFPAALLAELLPVLAAWHPPQRFLAHCLLGALLPVAPGGLRGPQAASLLSALWHEAHAPKHPSRSRDYALVIPIFAPGDTLTDVLLHGVKQELICKTLLKTVF